MEESTQEQTNNRPWLYKKGQSGNPGGRPVGSKSMKTYIKEKLASMTPEEREDFLEGVDKKVIWAMAEGNPESKSEVVIEERIDTKDPALLEALKVLKDKERNNL